MDGERARVADPGLFLAWLLEQKWVAVDTETAGFGWDDPVRLVQFGTHEEGWAVSTVHPGGRELVQRAVMEFPGGIVFHNRPFDIARLEMVGVDPDYIWPRSDDTDMTARMVDPGGKSNKLKYLGSRYLGADARDEQIELRKVQKKRKWTFANTPILVLTPYGIKDTKLTAGLHEYLDKRLPAQQREVMEKETEAAWAMYEVYRRGFRMDVEYAQQLDARWEKDLEMYRWYFQSYGVTNPNANRQLTDALQERFGWQPEHFTKSGEVQLDKVVLRDLIEDEYEFAIRLKEYRRINKWRQAYVLNCLEQRDAEDRVHANYNPVGARTGRMSCSNPPLQQLPKGGGGEVRRLFIASEGNLITSVDYSAIEMRLAASFSEDPKLVATYQAGGDVYQEMADSLDISRSQAKIVCLAALYGSRGKSIAKAIGETEARAAQIVADFWRVYPVLSRWAKGVEHSARKSGVYSKVWGRRLVPERGYAAPNYTIQGTAAEVMKEGIFRLAEQQLLQYVVAVVHDEVVLDVPKDAAEQVTQQVSCVLEDRRFLIPLTTEGTVYGQSWADGYGWQEAA